MARRIVAKDGPDPIDVHVGTRVRMRRTLLGMTQTQLGERVGVTFQQLQKYESGANRVSASRLFQISRILEVPVAYFFEGLDEGTPAWSPDDMVAKRETLELVRAYYRITDSDMRDHLRKLFQAVANLA